MIVIDYANPDLNGRLMFDVSAESAGRRLHSQRFDISDAIARETFAAAVQVVAGVEGAAADIVAQIAKHAALTPLLVTARNLIACNPNLLPPVITGLLRQREVMNVISAPKMRKSWMVLQLALCQCTGRAWLNMFPTTAGRVLIIDGELEPATLAHRLPLVASGLGITQDEYADRIDVYTLRGEAFDIDNLDVLFRKIQAGYYRLIIIDPLYVFLPEDAENSNPQMMRVYRTLIRYSRMSGAGIVVVHHTSKGVQGNKSITDTGAGAGAQSRAPDTHAVLREHEETDCAILDAVVRSWEPLKPIGLRWTFPTWTPEPTLDVARLKRDPAKGGRPRKDKPAKPEPIDWTPERFVAEFITATPTPKDAIVSKARRSKITHRDIQGFLAEATAAELIHRHRLADTTTGIAYATTPPTLFESKDCAQRESAHTPPTPPAKKRRKGRRS